LCCTGVFSQLLVFFQIYFCVVLLCFHNFVFYSELLFVLYCCAYIFHLLFRFISIMYCCVLTAFTFYLD
jgi:hypothetical protein